MKIYRERLTSHMYLIPCPMCGGKALFTYEENRVYQSECNSNPKKPHVITVEARSTDEALDIFSSMAIFDSPRKIFEELGEQGEVCLCPECGEDLMGAFEFHKMLQCKYCGCPIDQYQRHIETVEVEE